jgi:hypothetical protein
MTYTYQNELQRVKEYYAGDPLQKRFSALICGESGSGKTYLLRSCRRPIHVDSFDPGGTKCLRKWIDSGDVVADTQWEGDDPFDPTRFDKWMKAIELRFQIGYFDHFGTYCLDSATTWAASAMYSQLKSANRAGEVPNWGKDYVPQKNAMINYITKLMRLPCDFILTGHLQKHERVLSVDNKTGVVNSIIEYRFMTTGQAVVTIPLLFDELYVLKTNETSSGLERRLLTEAQGEYVARSRLKADGKLEVEEPADIKGLLKKIGLSWEDKPKLEV